MSQQDDRGNIGAWGIGLFLGLFVVAGLGALGLGLVELARGGENREELTSFFVIGAMFTLVPGTILMELLSALEKARDVERRKGEYPDEPWRWRKDWDGGILSSAPPKLLRFKWLTSLALAIGVALALANRHSMQHDVASTYFLLVIPALGALVLTLTTYTTIRWLVFRHSYCRLETLPGEIGGEFRAVVIPTPGKVQPGQFHGRLVCIRHHAQKLRGRRRTRAQILWAEDVAIPREHVVCEPDMPLAIPIQIAIPGTCRESTPGPASDRIEWELTVRAASPGINFYASFTVPVFRKPGGKLVESSNITAQLALPRIERTKVGRQ
jgi:hypothetical protein